MIEKRKVGGGLLSIIGFLLSPLSWWNDLFVNVPLALGAAWFVAAIEPQSFTAAFVFAYWATNVLGLIMVQKGAAMVVAKGKGQKYSTKILLLDLSVSAIYTVIIILPVKTGALKPIEAYLNGAR